MTGLGKSHEDNGDDTQQQDQSPAGVEDTPEKDEGESKDEAPEFTTTSPETLPSGDTTTKTTQDDVPLPVEETLPTTTAGNISSEPQQQEVQEDSNDDADDEGGDDTTADDEADTSPPTPIPAEAAPAQQQQDDDESATTPPAAAPTATPTAGTAGGAESAKAELAAQGKEVPAAAPAVPERMNKLRNMGAGSLPQPKTRGSWKRDPNAWHQDSAGVMHPPK